MNLYTQFQFWILFDVLIAKAIHYQCFMLHNPCHNIQIKKWCKIFLQQNYEGEDANCQTLIWAFDLKFGRREIILSSKTFWKPKLSCFWIGEKFKTKKIRALLVWLIAYNTLSHRLLSYDQTIFVLFQIFLRCKPKFYHLHQTKSIALDV